ncbi:MAG: LysE family translocator [Pseudobacter sp.]|uniref:LysE family translocator n=1 Tax=Pseudobacter sp. TaxID=2045420 RepID=UPI003F80A42D
MQLFRIFCIGLGISFLGTLPLGTLNVAAMQIAVTDGLQPALLFSLGALLVEICYVRLSLVAMDWVRKQEKLFRLLNWITLLIIIALAVSSFIAAAHPSGEAQNVILSNTMPRFFLGITLSAINPVQIPFWFGWSTVLFAKNILLPKPSHYNIYILGIGIGTFLGNAVFIFGGRLMVSSLNANLNILNYIIGGVFAITAIIQLYRMLTNKKAATVQETDSSESGHT